MTEFKPPERGFESNKEALQRLYEQEASDRSYQRLGRELLFQTVRDALALATNDKNRFKPFRAGSNRDAFDVDAAREKAHKQIFEWVRSDLFWRLAENLGYDPERARAAMLDLLQGKNVDEIQQFVKELKHDGRIYEGRGPKPREKGD